MRKLHPEARHHARRSISYLAEAYDLGDEVLIDNGYLAIDRVSEAVIVLNSPDHVGVRIRMERGGHMHFEARHEDGPWLAVLHRFSQEHLQRLFDRVSAIDQDKTMGQPPPKQKGDT